MVNMVAEVKENRPETQSVPKKKPAELPKKEVPTARDTNRRRRPTATPREQPSRFNIPPGSYATTPPFGNGVNGMGFGNWQYSSGPGPYGTSYAPSLPTVTYTCSCRDCLISAETFMDALNRNMYTTQVVCAGAYHDRFFGTGAGVASPAFAGVTATTTMSPSGHYESFNPPVAAYYDFQPQYTVAPPYSPGNSDGSNGLSTSSEINGQQHDNQGASSTDNSEQFEELASNVDNDIKSDSATSSVDEATSARWAGGNGINSCNNSAGVNEMNSYSTAADAGRNGYGNSRQFGQPMTFVPRNNEYVASPPNNTFYRNDGLMMSSNYYAANNWRQFGGPPTNYYRGGMNPAYYANGTANGIHTEVPQTRDFQPDVKNKKEDAVNNTAVGKPVEEGDKDESTDDLTDLSEEIDVIEISDS